MSEDPFEERSRRADRAPTASDERKKLRSVWKRMQYNYSNGARSWDKMAYRAHLRKVR